MKFEDISVPEIYKESADFRFFLDWFYTCLEKVKYDTEHVIDLYDPLRCPSNLLWLLGDNMGFKFDSRFCPAYNRLIMLYFMTLIHNKGSKTGVTVAAELNLAQFSIDNYGKENDILYDRLEDTSIPVNSVYVTSHVDEGYIDVVYMSTLQPKNACLEYVRPLGMYVFEHPGVRFDARTKISVDARLANSSDYGVSIGPTRVGHYRRSDYASMQQMQNEREYIVNDKHTRNPVWYRNSDYEEETSPNINPGYRSLYSLQLCNNEHIVDSILVDPNSNKPIFSLGYKPQTEADIQVLDNSPYLTEDYLKEKGYADNKEYYAAYNLRYNKDDDKHIDDVGTLDENRQSTHLSPKPAVNPIMSKPGDAMPPEGEANDDK